MKVEVAVLGSLSLIDRMVSVEGKATLNLNLCKPPELHSYGRGEQGATVAAGMLAFLRRTRPRFLTGKRPERTITRLCKLKNKKNKKIKNPMVCIRCRPIYSLSAILRGLYRVWGKCDKAEMLSNTKLPTRVIV